MATKTEADIEALEAERLARLEHLAGLDLAELFDEATDAELSAESMRCGRAMSKLHSRGLGISHKKAIARLDAGIGELPTLVDQLREKLRGDVLRRPSGAKPSTLVELAMASDALARKDEIRAIAVGVLEPDGTSITKDDRTAAVSKERRALNERQAEIGVEALAPRIRTTGRRPAEATNEGNEMTDQLSPEERVRLGLGPPPRPKTAEEVRKAAGMTREEWVIWSEASDGDDANRMLEQLAEIKDEKAKADLRERIEQLEDAEA